LYPPPKPRLVEPARARRRLAGVIFLVLLAQVLLYPGVDALVAALGATTTLNASMWFLAAEFAAFVVFAGVWGAVSDASGTRTPLIVLGATLGAAGYLVLAVLPGPLARSFAAVLTTRVLQGAATVGAFSLAMTTLLDLPGPDGRNMGAAGLAIGTGTALGAPLGGQLYEVGTLVPLYAATGILLAAAALATTVPDRVPAEDRETAREALAGLRETPALLVPYTFGFVDRTAAGFFALVGTLYFRESFGLSPGETGLVLSLFFAPFALLQYPFGALSDRVGRTAPIAGGSAAFGLAVAAVGRAPTVALAGAGMIAVGVLGALMAPATMALVGDLVSDRRRGVAMGGFNVAGSVGFLAGIVGGGVLAGAYGYPVAFLIVGGVELVLAAVATPALIGLERSVAPERRESSPD
jgi:MFS family permease